MSSSRFAGGRASGLQRSLRYSAARRVSITSDCAKTLTRWRIQIQHHVPKHRRALLDTSVVIDLDRIEPAELPEEPMISAITMAELTAGPGATDDREERARRQDRLARAEASFAPLPFDDGAARAYGRIYAAVAAAGRKPRGPRALDLLIASIALNARLPLYTRNPSDVEALNDLIEIVGV